MRRNKTALFPLKRGPLTLLTHGVLLFLALYGTVFSFATAFALDVYPLWVLLACGISAGLFLAVFSLPRLRWLALLMVIGLCALAAWRLWDTLVLGEIWVRCSVVNTFAAQFPSIGAIHPIAQLPQETWTQSATLLISAAALPLGGLLALAVVRLRSFWLMLLFSLPFVAIPVGITVTPGWLPLMALLCVWCAMGLTSLAGRRDPKGGIRLTWITLPVCAALLLLLTVAMPADSYQRPAWADKANHTLTNWLVRISDRFFPDSGAGPLVSSNNHVDLSQAGPLEHTGRTVLRVEADLHGRVYLRGFSAGVYEDNQWNIFPQEVYDQLWWDDGTVSIDESDVPQLENSWTGEDALIDPELTPSFESSVAASPDEYSYPILSGLNPSSSLYIPSLNGMQPMNFPALADRNSSAKHKFLAVTVENLGADPGYVYYPYQILTTPEQVNGAQFVYDGCLAREEGVWEHTLYIMPECDPLAWAELPEEAKSAEYLYRQFVYQNYLDVPAELWDTLQSCWLEIYNRPGYVLSDAGMELYGQLLSGRPMDAREAYLICAELVADYLANLAVYDPNTPLTPEGEDFVEYFLTESRQGYCMHFASAATLLLRSMGIPARYVAGYVADIPISGWVNVPDSNAHAWVEIYIEGYGWHPIEVTPAYAGSTPGLSGTSPEAGNTPEASSPVGPIPQPVSPEPTNTPKPTTAPNTAEAPLSPLQRFPVVLAIVLAAVAALLTVLALRRKLILRRRTRRWRDADANRGVIHAYRHLTRLARWGGEIPEEAERLAKKARFSQHRLTEEERLAVLTAVTGQAERLDAALPRWKRLVLRYLLALW